MDKRVIQIKYWYAIFCGIIAVVVFFYYSKSISDGNEMFPRLTKDDKIVDKKVKSVEVERGHARVAFESDIKRTIYFARNNSYQPIDLPLFLRVNDVFTKRENSDSISVRRDDGVYIFLLDKEIMSK